MFLGLHWRSPYAYTVPMNNKDMRNDRNAVIILADMAAHAREFHTPEWAAIKAAEHARARDEFIRRWGEKPLAAFGL